MANQRNYQKELDDILHNLNRVPTLLLHSCCAPCSSYVLEYLSQYFSITVFYYNPNISSSEEYEKRLAEQQRLIASLPVKYPIQLEAGGYEPEDFYGVVRGMEQEPEGGSRCYRCYRLRLQETAKLAQEKGFDYFTTTLSISPLKNATWLNEIGEDLSREYDVTYLVSDFKKKGGYQRSIALSKEYDLYRQNFCGCVYSRRDRENMMREEGYL